MCDRKLKSEHSAVRAGEPPLTDVLWIYVELPGAASVRAKNTTTRLADMVMRGGVDKSMTYDSWRGRWVGVRRVYRGRHA